MQQRRRTRLAAAALALALAALPGLAQEAQDAPEAETPPPAEAARVFSEPVEADASPTTTEAEQATLQKQWDAQRDALLTQQARAEAELAAVRELNADLEDDRQIRWMLIGGGLVLIGLVLGVLIKSRPQRRDAWQ